MTHSTPSAPTPLWRSQICAAESSDVGGRVLDTNDQEVVAACAGFHEGNRGHEESLSVAKDRRRRAQIASFAMDYVSTGTQLAGSNDRSSTWPVLAQ